MWKIWFKVNGEVACLAKEYKTKPNAAKLANKVFGKDTEDVVVAQENPFVKG